MYAGVDIGGTKTLAASLDDNGVLKQKIRFETPKNYDAFLGKLAEAFQSLETKDFTAGGIGAPGNIDRARGGVVRFGNLGWKNVPLQADVEQITKCPMALENDSKMAGLSEAMLVKETYKKVLYVTISTGIGFALIVNRRIDASIGDAGGSAMFIEHRGQLKPWESFASGRAIVEHYGKRAEDINDTATWKRIVRDLAPGFLELIALTQPEVIVIGGSVGTHFNKYGQLLASELHKYRAPLLTIPPLRGAGRPEEAVLFGCYDLAKQVYSHEHHNDITTQGASLS